MISALLALSMLAPAPTPTAAGASVRKDMVVSVPALAKRLGDPALVVLHASEKRDTYDAGHVPGARFVAKADIAVERDGIPNELPALDDLIALARRLGITETSRIVVYDDESGLLAARTFVAMDALGLGDRTSMLDGHLAAWKEAGRPLATDGPTVTPSTFTPRPRPETLIAKAAVRDLVEAAATTPALRMSLVDARPPAEYAGTEPGSGVQRPGHIPGAGNVFWKDQLRGTRLKPMEELRTLHHAAGVEPGDLVVSYCRTGMQASHAYFVLRLLGHDVRLYDGSFIEWSADADAPVVPPEAPAALTSTGPAKQ